MSPLPSRVNADRRAAVAAGAVLVAAAGLAGCASTGGTLTSRVTNWASSSAIAALDLTVLNDVQSYEGALKASKTLTAKTLCGVLDDDVGQAYVTLPAPDSQLTSDLDQAYILLGQGATDCYKALGGSGQAALEAKANSEIVRGNELLEEGSARLASFGVRVSGTGITGNT